MGLTMTKRFEFTASHWLIGMHDPACGVLHSHDYKLDLTLQLRPGVDLENGVLFDTGFLKIDLAPVIARVKNKVLNEIKDQSNDGMTLKAQPSLENFTLWWWSSLQFLRNSARFQLIHLRLYETDKFWCDISL